MKNLLMILFFSLFVTSCEEKKNLSKEVIKQTESINESDEIASCLDSIPNLVFLFLSQVPFVKEKIDFFRKNSIRVFYWCHDEFQNNSERYHFQLSIETEIRFRPIFNFEYQPDNGKLFYLDTSSDSLILLK